MGESLRLLIEQALGWAVLGALAVGIWTAARSYRVSHGRRENVLVSGLKRGCIHGVVVAAMLIPICLLAGWLLR